MPDQTLLAEFDRQVENLLEKGYPQFSGASPDDFMQHIAPLRTKIDDLPAQPIDFENGRLPFVIVVKSDGVSTTDAMSQVKRQGKAGFVKMYPRQPEDFSPIDGVAIPDVFAYLLIDIDRGKGNINVAPSGAMKMIVDGGRSPLTIDEGVAIVTQHPEFLMKNNCFSLLASRHPGDKRVPALWITGTKQPRLGWCWDGNPHTWLGSASCAGRIPNDID